MSLASQAVHLLESLWGCGHVGSSLTRAHQVDLDRGIRAGIPFFESPIICDKRKKPVKGIAVGKTALIGGGAPARREICWFTVGVVSMNNTSWTNDRLGKSYVVVEVL